MKGHLQETGFPILDVDDVVEAFMRLLAADGTGEAWYVVPGRPSEPFRFRGVPGPR
jgi:nucleoside-diphosphate-sugar epimerase